MMRLNDTISWKVIGLLVFLMCFSNYLKLFSQQGKTNTVHVGIVYPLSTNGSTAPLDTNYFSLHLIAGISQQENNCLLTGMSGLVKGNMYGVAVAGVSNHVGGDAKGVQMAGVLNQIRHRAYGIQAAGVANVTGDASGVQVAGLLNKAGDAHVQLAGLVNIAKKVRGVQVAGLINIAEESKYPIGILNIIKSGEIQLGVMVDEGGTTFATLRSGGEVLYGLLGVGYNFKDDEARYALEGGLGAHLISKNAFRFNVELANLVATSFDDGVYNKQSIRALVGYRIAPRLELLAGPTFNHLHFDVDQHDIRNGRYIWKHQGDDNINGFFFGAVAGLQFTW